ncbi:MAG: hypothetical protein KDA81_22515, partial [Planctomycetaceae bacterium]|nr:hypothetical protein [Planctomycetaceae bacterium]
PHKTCINLVVDGKTVRTATGKNTDQMEVHSWDVSELRGKTARLEIIDHHSGGWGHTDIDRIVFTDRSSDRIDRAIAKVSEADELDANDLRTVALALKDMGVQAESSPLAVFRHCIDAAQGQSVGVSLTEWAAKNLPVDSAQDSETVLMADLTHGLPDGWFVNGQAFAWDSASGAAEAVADNVANGVVSGLSGETSGLQNFHPRSKTKSFSGLQWQGQQLAYRPEGDGGVSSATLSPELRGSLQSPTFELQHPEILIRVAGEGCRVRLVIDGYVMNEFSELLFRGARHDIKTEGRFVWIRLGNDVHRYVGHRAYLEFLDEGNGWFSVAEVRFAKSAGAQPPQLQPSGFNQELATAL